MTAGMGGPSEFGRRREGSRDVVCERGEGSEDEDAEKHRWRVRDWTLSQNAGVPAIDRAGRMGENCAWMEVARLASSAG